MSSKDIAPPSLTGPRLMSWTLPYRIPFSDVDHAGIVFYAHIFTYCHLAFEHLYLEAVGEPISTIFTRRGYATPVVATEAVFRRPMRHGDTIVIDVHAEHVGTSAFTLGFLFKGEAGEERCTARVTHAAIAWPGFTKIPIPDDLGLVLSLRRS